VDLNLFPDIPLGVRKHHGVDLMYLSAYLEMQGMSQREFADEIGVSASSIGNYILGKRTPDLKTAITIEKKTRGKVTAQELWEYAKKIKATK
jgi:transcriptional regulator with XRE-family HTH domain